MDDEMIKTFRKYLFVDSLCVNCAIDSEHNIPAEVKLKIADNNNSV